MYWYTGIYTSRFIYLVNSNLDSTSRFMYHVYPNLELLQGVYTGIKVNIQYI